MLIKLGYPPNIEEIKKYFPITNRTVFAYGDTLYCFDPAQISPDLLIHETVHSQRQTNPEQWWKQYLEDKDFRLNEEIRAYHSQYVFFQAKHKSQRTIDYFLHCIARDLSSPLYGNLLSYDEARERIINGK